LVAIPLVTGAFRSALYNGRRGCRPRSLARESGGSFKHSRSQSGAKRSAAE